MSPRELTVLLAMCSVWGFHFIVIKTAVGEIPPMFYAAIRMTLVALIMAPFLRWRSGRMGKIAAAGICVGALNYAFMFTGINLATASASAIAIELYVPFATILSVIFLGEKIGWRRIIGIAFAFAGVAVIALGKSEAKIGVGVGLVAIAAFTEAIGAILIKKSPGFRPQELLAWFAVVGSVTLWALTAIFETGQAEALVASDHWLIAGAIVYSALGASVFGHTAYYWLLQRLPVSTVAPSGLLTTLLAVAFSIPILGEPFGLRFVIGGLMTILGVGIVILRSAGSAPQPGAPEPVVAAPPVASATVAGGIASTPRGEAS